MKETEMEENINKMQEELRESPLLNSLDRKEPFPAPEGYFDSLMGRMEDKILDIEVLENAPGFQKIEKKEPFSAPEGYFEAFPQKISKLISEEGKTTDRVIPFQNRVRKQSFVLLTAAAMILLFFTGNWFFQPESSNPVEQRTSEVTVDDLLALAETGDLGEDILMEIIALENSEIPQSIDLNEAEWTEITEEFDLSGLDLGDF